MTDAGNQIAWIVHSCNPFDPPAPSIEQCLTLCAMPFLPPTPNPQLATRIQLKLFGRKGNHVINVICVAKQHHQTIDSQCITAGIRHVF